MHIALWLLLGMALTAVAVWFLWWALGSPELTADPKPLAPRDKLDGLKIAFAVVAGIGGVIALTVAYRKQRLGEAAERRADTTAFTDRFGKASELMGSERAAVRLAGVYAMAALADDWHEQRQTCINVLCAYLRMPYDPPGGLGRGRPRERPHRLGLRKSGRPRHETCSPVRRDEDPREERQVRRTVLAVITAHLRPGAANSWQGCGFDFTGATFDGGEFVGIVVPRGTALIFNDAEFVGGELNFRRARFSGGILDFEGAEFSGGTVDFGRAEFSAGDIDFRRVKFSGGKVSFHSASFGVLPYFDAWPDGPPSGLTLPPAATDG